MGRSYRIVSPDPIAITVNACAVGGVRLESVDACVSMADANAHGGA
jgi:hypothetical protein